MEQHFNESSTSNAFIQQHYLKRKPFQIGVFIGSLSSWGLFMFILIISLLIIVLGIWIGYFRFQSGVKDPSDPLNTTVGSILGLLGFLLGFAFSITWSRFGTRNGLVSSQAKAIGVCYLRTSLLPEKQKSELRKLFHEYVNVLLELQSYGNIGALIPKLEELNILIWNQTASLVQEEMDSEIRSLFTNAVNELINVYMERKTIGLVYRIPDAVWTRLLTLAWIGMFAFGYQTGNNGMNHFFQTFMLPVAFAMVIILIADLDSTMKQRLFKVTKQPLQDLLEMMGREIV